MFFFLIYFHPCSGIDILLWYSKYLHRLFRTPDEFIAIRLPVFLACEQIDLDEPNDAAGSSSVVDSNSEAGHIATVSPVAAGSASAGPVDSSDDIVTLDLDGTATIAPLANPRASQRGAAPQAFNVASAISP